MEAICLPKKEVRKIASYQLEVINKAKEAMNRLLSIAPRTMKLEEEIRGLIALSVWTDHKNLMEEECECFKQTEVFKVAEDLVRLGKFNNLKEAIHFMCD